jgi:hypothetical protein
MRAAVRMSQSPAPSSRLGRAGTVAEEAMAAGPSTVRPSARRRGRSMRIPNRNITRTVVTLSNGVLIVLRREDLEGETQDPPRAKEAL